MQAVQSAELKFVFSLELINIRSTSGQVEGLNYLSITITDLIKMIILTFT